MRSPLLFVGLALLCVSPSVLAQDDTAINDAYQKAAEGLTKYKAGRYAEALDDYTRAYTIVHLPALAVHIARANVKLGRFVAAMQFYDEALTLPDGVGDPQIQARARVDAKAEGQALLPRIPRLLFHAPGVNTAGVTIRVDGAVIPNEAYGAGWFADPGSHQVVASYGTQVQSRWIAVSEGDARDLTFTFAPVQASSNARPLVRDKAQTAQTPSNLRTLAWVSMGVGGAGLLVWGTTGALALNKSKDLHCGGSRPPCPESELNGYNHWKTASTVGFYTGAAAMLTGVTLYLLEPKQKNSRDKTSRMIPWLGVGSAGVEGQF